MRIMPFMKRKKGIQFAGVGLDEGGGGSGSLPVASTETLGGIKVGENLTIDSEGVLSAEGGGGLNYSTTEFDTGKKWIDGKTIYGKLHAFESASLIQGEARYIDGFTCSMLVTAVAYDLRTKKMQIPYAWCSSDGFWMNGRVSMPMSHVYLEYTK